MVPSVAMLPRLRPTVVHDSWHLPRDVEPAEVPSRTLMRVAPLSAVGIGTAVLVVMQLFSTA